MGTGGGIRGTTMLGKNRDPLIGARFYSSMGGVVREDLTSRKLCLQIKKDLLFRIVLD